MGMSTRSKTGSRLPAARIIEKPATAPSRHPKGKKGTRTPAPRAAPGVGGSPGSRFPDDVNLLTDVGEHVNTGALLTAETPGLILFTYPRANTPGCTTQACNMRDSAPDFSKLGYSVFGMSYDKPGSQAGWKAKHTLGYTLLCDTADAGVIKMLGAHKAPKGIKRSVFVVRKDANSGKPTVVFSSIGCSPKDSVPLVKGYVESNPALPAATEKKEDDKAANKEGADQDKEEKPADTPNGS